MLINSLLENILLSKSNIIVIFSCIDRKVNLKTAKHKNIDAFLPLETS